MTFPVIFYPFGQAIPAHPVFEALAYALGFQTYLMLRRWRGRWEPVAVEHQLWIFVGCVFGAFFGSKVLAWIESWPDYWQHRGELEFWVGGKTIVGGFIGAWIGVELVKKILGLRTRTGDGYVIPLCIGIAVGRIGCFLTGLPDHTYGTPTALPWGIDFGDGIPRHPTQLYEIAWALLMLVCFAYTGTGWCRDTHGRAFRVFLMGYFLFRFAIEFIKPSWKGYAGLSAIQWASLIATGVAAWQWARNSSAGETFSRSRSSSSAC